MRLRSLAGGVLAFAVATHPGDARAERPAPTPVEIFVAGTPDTLARLENAIGVADRPIRWVQIGALDVADVVRRPGEGDARAPAGERAGAARAWIDCSRPDFVRIYFANWNAERFLLRDVPLPGGWNEIALEAIGQVVDSSLSALGANDGTAMSRAEMVSALEPKPAPPPPRPTWDATLGAFYGVQAFAAEQAVAQGPGLVGTLGPRGDRWRWGGWLSAQYRLPATTDTPLIGVRLDTVALRVGPSLTYRAGPRIDLTVQLGLGADLVHIAPRQGPAGDAALSPDRVSVAYAAEIALVAAVGVAPSVSLWGAALADADLGERRYDVVVDGSAVNVVTPWVIQPGVMAGISWSWQSPWYGWRAP